MDIYYTYRIQLPKPTHQLVSFARATQAVVNVEMLVERIIPCRGTS